MCFVNEAGFTAASLLIISELIRVKDDLKFNLYSFHSKGLSTAKLAADDSDEEERFYDVDKLQE